MTKPWILLHCSRQMGAMQVRKQSYQVSTHVTLVHKAQIMANNYLCGLGKAAQSQVKAKAVPACTI